MELREFTSFQQLYKEYTSKHLDKYVGQEEFEALVLSAPMFLVANADGHLAASEISVITEHILKMYSNDEVLPENSDNQDVSEFNYFLNDFEAWKDKFLQVLKEYISQDTEKQKLTLIMMEAVANAHHHNPVTAIQLVLNDHTHSDIIDGKEDLTASVKYMSTIEKNTIKEIALKLGLYNNPALKNDLSRLN
jgi:glutathionylspermidine synthase